MHRSLVIIVAVLVVCTLSAQADLMGTYKTITIDGSLADWTGADTLYNDAEIGDGTPDSSTYENISVANDATSLFVALDTKGTGGGDINNTWTRNLYMDTDLNGGSGFNAGWMSHGYDRLIQYGASGGSYSVFEFTGATQADWGWNFLGLITYSYADDIAEWSIPISQLGITGDSAVMEFNVTGTGVTLETWGHSSEASAETYTLAVPEPSSALLLLIGAVGISLYRRRFRE